MRVRSFQYSEFLETPRAWTLQKSDFGSINLVVGRNASGKTRFINVLNGASAILAGEFPELFESGTYEIVFTAEKLKCKFNFELRDKKVHSELFELNGKQLLRRHADGSGTIWGDKLGQNIDFKIPETGLASVIKRDMVQHPFLEPLHVWARSVRRYQFGSDLGQRNVFTMSPTGFEKTSAEATFMPSTNPERVIQLYLAGFQSFGEKFDETILNDFKKIGYDCEEVGARPFEELKVPNAIPVMLFVKERDLPGQTRQFEMSMGMYRSLALLINLNYSIMTKQTSCVLIDDIGEGLDFERSMALIKLIIDKCRQHKFQLFMTTNDRFVMNDVDLKYWHIIEREANVVRMLNYRNSTKAFKEFKFMGLNNFDFFATRAYLGRGEHEKNSDIR